MQTFGTDLDRRAQVNAVRTLLLQAIKAWSPYFEKVRIVAVGGNHGENRSAKGKAYTTLADNDDLAVIDQVRDVLEFNPETYGHVQTIIAPDHLTVTIETAGWILGLTHGHTARETGSAEAKIKSWLSRMALGRQPIGECDILVTGHYHHLRQADWGSVQWLQAPALDGGSEWFRLIRGEQSAAGVLTFATYPEAKVKDLQVL
jgi:predicted phosphodiesterase